jgi:ADP-heptose:LPS heptosyltransferase
LTRGRQLPLATRWDGRDPAGRTILLTAEQGLGDALQFVRFARPLAARGARVLVEASPPLARLLATAPGVAATCAAGAPPPPHDLHLPLLSLAGVLGVEADTIPNEVPYVRPDAQEAAAIALELRPHRPNLLVGLSWAGNPRYSADRRRSCPLAALAPLLEMPGITFFSLQRDDGEDQLPGVPAARDMVLLDARRDFDRKAALVDALDLVISVDTSHAHLAGALARPVWVLLPFSPDWRWQLDRTDSPWYPTARLFRQSRHGQWAAPVDAMRQALAAMVADRR